MLSFLIYKKINMTNLSLNNRFKIDSKCIPSFILIPFYGYLHRLFCEIIIYYMICELNSIFL